MTTKIYYADCYCSRFPIAVGNGLAGVIVLALNLSLLQVIPGVIHVTATQANTTCPK